VMAAAVAPLAARRRAGSGRCRRYRRCPGPSCHRRHCHRQSCRPRHYHRPSCHLRAPNCRCRRCRSYRHPSRHRPGRRRSCPSPSCPSPHCWLQSCRPVSCDRCRVGLQYAVRLRAAQPGRRRVTRADAGIRTRSRTGSGQVRSRRALHASIAFSAAAQRRLVDPEHGVAGEPQDAERDSQSRTAEASVAAPSGEAACRIIVVDVHGCPELRWVSRICRRVRAVAYGSSSRAREGRLL
jgi:hypothetical protein